MTDLLELINTVLLNSGKPIVTSIEDGQDLRKDLGMDSFNLAELTVRIEEKYDVDVFEHGIVKTVSELKSLLKIQ